MSKVLPPLTNPDGNWVLWSRRQNDKNDTYVNQASMRSIGDTKKHLDYEIKKHTHPEVHLAFAEFRYNIKGKNKVERKATNAYNFKCLAFDVDCGESKTYKDFNEGFAATQVALAELQIDEYIAVMSGSGVHCYILLSEIISKKTWLEMSSTLGRKLTKLGLAYDPAKIKDAAMTLRLPGSFNMKTGKPVETYLLKDTTAYWQPHILDELFDHIPDPPDVIKDYDYVETGTRGKWEAAGSDYELVQEHCNQIKAVALDANIPEPLWHTVIGVAAGCDKASKAALTWSCNHDRFSEKNTLTKLATYKKSTTGPSLCTRFIELNPNGCKGCKYKGTINTPVQLGNSATLRKANNPYEDFDAALESSEIKIILDPEEKVFLPNPYYLNKRGWICVDVAGETNVVSIHPIYVSQIANHSDERSPFSMLTLRYKLPYKKWSSLQLDVGLLNSASLRGESFGAKLMHAGFYMEKKDLAKLQSFVIQSLNARQVIEAPEKIVANYGWTTDGTFILGNKEYGEKITTIGIAKDDTLAEMNRNYVELGSLEQWSALSSVFLMPNMEVAAFSLFLSFGAPLMELSNLGACVINLQSEDTGIGKSLMGFWGQSIYGNPYQTKSEAGDSHIASFIKLGLLKNVPLYIDEVSTWEGEQVSEFVYAASTGQDKLRGTRDAGLRKRERWNTLAITSSNTSLNDLLDQHTTISQGQKARLLELDFPTNEKFMNLGERIALAISQNYGVAGAMYIKELVRRRIHGDLEKTVNNLRQQYEVNFNFKFMNEERFKFTAIGVSWLGAKIAQEIGLINEKIDIHKVFVKINQIVLAQRKGIIGKKETALEAVAQFLTQHHKHFVKVRKFGMSGSAKGDGTCPIESLYGRFELLFRSKAAMERPERGYISISVEEFKTFCGITKRSYLRFETELSKIASYKKHNANLASGIDTTLNGSDAPQLPVKCISFEFPSEMLEFYELQENAFNTDIPYGV